MPKLLTIGQGAKIKAKKIEVGGGVHKSESIDANVMKLGG